MRPRRSRLWAGTLRPQRHRLTVTVHPASQRIAGHAVDTVEVAVRFPRQSSTEARLFHALFGERLVLATAFVGDKAVFALGHDVRSRLGALISAASGHHAPSLGDDPRLAAALAFRPDGRVSMSWLSTEGMASFIERLMREGERARPFHGRSAPSDNEGAFAALAGRGSIVTVSTASGGRYEISTHVPASTLPSLHATGGVLLRMALSPILNPPAVPPLPLPPAHVTPPVPSPSDEGPGEAGSERRRL